MRWYKTRATGFSRWELANDADKPIACIDKNPEGSHWLPYEWEYSIYDNGLGGPLQPFPDHVRTFEEKKAYVLALARLA